MAVAVDTASLLGGVLPSAFVNGITIAFSSGITNERGVNPHYDIPKKDIRALSEYVLQRAEEMYSMSQYNPRKATLENLTEFFERAIEGRESINL